MTDGKPNVAPPWITYSRRLHKLFELDPEVRVEYVEDDEKAVKLYVESQEKADALSKVLPGSVSFGNVDLKIEVIPANVDESPFKMLEKAFKGNPVVSYTETVPAYGQELNFVVFQPEVVQYRNDNIGDIHGIESTLYQDIAKEVFCEIPGVLFCTDIEDQAFLGKPLGEWP